MRQRPWQKPPPVSFPRQRTRHAQLAVRLIRRIMQRDLRGEERENAIRWMAEHFPGRGWESLLMIPKDEKTPQETLAPPEGYGDEG